MARTAPAGKPRSRTRCACTIAQSQASPVTYAVVDFADGKLWRASQETRADPARPARSTQRTASGRTISVSGQRHSIEEISNQANTTASAGKARIMASDDVIEVSSPKNRCTAVERSSAIGSLDRDRRFVHPSLHIICNTCVGKRNLSSPSSRTIGHISGNS